MKKIITYSAIAAIALAAVSCTKEEMNPGGDQPALKQITLSVGAAEDATKSSLDGTKTINWEAGDKIGVWDGTALREFTTTESGPSAIFTGEISETATELYAKYPYVSTDTWASGVVTTSIPTVQTAVTGSFAKDANVSVGKATITAGSSDWSMSMKNVCSYFKFTLANGDRKVKSVTLSAQKDRTVENTLAAMTGGVSITVSGTPTAASASPLYYSAKLTTDNDLGLAEGDYYIAILPQTYADGISLTFTSTDGMTAFLRKSSSLTFERNTPSSFSSSIHTSSSLNWKETEVLVLDFAGTKSDGPFTTPLADLDTGAVNTYTLNQNSTNYTFVAKGYMQYHSSYGFTLFNGSYNYPGSSKKQGANLGYLKLPAISGKRLASVEMTPTSSTGRQGYAAVCEDEVGDSWTILSNSYNTQIRNRTEDFGWYDLKTTKANTSYRIGNTGTKSYSSTGYFNVNKITLTYVGGDAPTPAPNLTLNFAGNILTASVDQAGSTVYYETSTTSMEDVPTPTTSSEVLPSTGVNLAGSITYVKAFAVKGDKQSDVKEITCDGTKVLFGTTWTYDTTVVGFGQSFKRYIEKFGKEKFIDGASYSAYNLTVWNSSTEAFSAAFQYGSLRVQANDKVKHKFTVGSTGAARLRLNISSKDPGYTKNRKLSVDLNGTSYYSNSTGIPDVGEGNDPKSGWVDIDFPADKIKSGDVITIHIGYCRLYGIYWEAAE